MGQYYKIVNVTKRQYLHPHKFGAGLKLMEFSGQGDSIGQALIILLAHANNRGGGDLRSDNLTEEEMSLIGSWAGDQIVVAGDYDDPWLFVPEEFKNKEYEVEDEDGKKVKAIFGQRSSHIEGEFYPETLYSTASQFFTDISDDIIKVVAKGDSPYHPWAAMDLADDGWRDCPLHGILPKKEPEEPAGGNEAWLKYKKNAVPQSEDLVSDLKHYLRRNPEKRSEILALLQVEIIDAT